MNRGYFGIGIENVKTSENIGSLWRSAFIFGASFIFTIGNRYKKQASDTPKSWRHIPLYNYNTFNEFYELMPYNCKLTGIELSNDSIPIKNYNHPERCIYILGAEDNGLSKEAILKCHDLIIIPGTCCLNVSIAGSIVLFDRIQKK